MHFEGIDNILQVALQNLRKGVAGKADTVVSYSGLRVVGRIPGVAVKCVDIGRNTSGEGGPLD